MNLDSIRERYRSERETFAELAREMEHQLRIACKRAGIYCNTQSRAKDVGSLVKKALSKSKPYEEIRDKAAVRIIPIYSDQRDRVLDVVRATVRAHEEEDHTEKLVPDQFAYRGVHFQARLRVVPAERQHLAPLEAEVQVHTLGESLWAVVSHDLQYKTQQLPSRRAQRIIARLAALLEQSDVNVSEAREIVLGREGAVGAEMLGVLEREFFKFVARDYSSELSMAVLGGLMPSLGDGGELAASVEVFVAANEQRLAGIFTQYAEDYRNPLLSQPEALLLFYLLDTDRRLLEGSWPEFLPEVLLEQLETIWV